MTGVGDKRRVPAGYDPRDYPAVAVTVDVVVLTIEGDTLSVVLVERAEDPFQGCLALPGGFVRPDETLDGAAARELSEETAVEAAGHLEQFRAYGDPGRDPRMRIVTVAYLAVVRAVGPLRGGTDAAAARLVPVAQLLGPRARRRLAFDHRRILADGVEVARAKLESTSLATAFVGPEFTLSELRRVYEAAWGQRLDPGNFRRKVLSTPGLVVSTGVAARPGPAGGKPPETYRRGPAERLDPPLHRPSRDG